MAGTGAVRRLPLYGNVQLRRVRLDPDSATLTLGVLYVGREELEVVYKDVVYSQFGRSNEGERISVAEELSLPALEAEAHRETLDALRTDTGWGGRRLEELAARGYRFFAHRTGGRDESIVVARELLIPPSCAMTTAAW